MKNNIYRSKIWIDKFVHQQPVDACDKERVNKIVNMVPEDAGAILDVGIGGGYIYRELEKNKGIKCFGIDLSPELVARMRGSNVCVADVRAIPFKNGQFDLVLAADLLEHVRGEFFSDSVSELIRVSKKYILVNSPYKDAIDWPVSLCNICKKEFNIYGHLRTIDMRLIKRIFPKSKFDIMQIEVFGRKRESRPSPLVYMARRWGNVYSEEGAICPYCFNATIDKPLRKGIEIFFGKVMAGIFFLMDNLTPSFLKRGSEMRVLLRKKYAIQ